MLRRKYSFQESRRIWNVIRLMLILAGIFFGSIIHAYAQKTGIRLQNLSSPILFKGDDKTAFRDPAILYHKNSFYLFFTLVQTESDGRVYSYTAQSHSADLKTWTPPQIITPRNQNLDFSSPGNVVFYKGEWILCLQTYPRPDYMARQMPRFGTGDARIFVMRSKDLKSWSPPELLKVKGPNVNEKDMGRIIDPYLIRDKTEKTKWWCFYKQNGVSRSYSYDLKNWTYAGHIDGGENACVLSDKNGYILFHSPKNGIAIKRSADLEHWTDWGNLITLGQSQWPWAKGRLTAGTVVDLRRQKKFGRYVMFFHGSGPKTEEQGDFDKHASIGIAWSKDLLHWNWPGEKAK